MLISADGLANCSTRPTIKIDLGAEQSSLSIKALKLFCVSLVSVATAACDGAVEMPPHADVRCLAPGEGAEGSVAIPAGTVRLGEGGVYPEEGPLREVSIKAFEIDRTEVTNQAFSEFVDATGYVTRAERGLDATVAAELPVEFHQPGSLVFSPPEAREAMTPSAWWRFTPGADWRHPFGPGSTIEGKERYPVVHIAIEDAIAYANWKGRRLPTEAEWEYAAA
ncbi:MAG: SUMF1/EgtB/PvdO family nonheme iron enzyme, partial [Amphiplicatus sp.]